MIVAIDELLWNWAQWRLQKDGSPSCSALSRLMAHNTVFDNAFLPEARIPTDQLAAASMEHYVMALDPVLRRVIAEVYLWTNPTEQKARNCLCSLSTFYRRLDKAHELIQKMQRDSRENGIEPRPWQTLPIGTA